MELTIFPGKPLIGSVGTGEALPLPGDKSLSHRAALFAALAEGESRIDHFLDSGVTRAMLSALSALGVTWELEGERLRVEGRGMAGLRAPADPINCGNSATTLRLLAGALAAAGIPAVLDGSPGLRRRPMDRIITPLRRMGVLIVSEAAAERETAPLRIGPRLRSQRLAPLHYHLPVASAQVKTCLLLAALSARDETMLWEPGPSRDHTERLLAEMGVDVSIRTPTQSSIPCSTGGSWSIVWLRPLEHSHQLAPLQMTLPGDFSAAAFLIVAALITPDSHVSIRGTGLNPLRTGLLDALQAMGARIRVTSRPDEGGEPVGDLEIEHSPLKGIEVSGELVVRMIDEFPIFAIAAAYAQGETVIRDAQELRLKESDRISAICGELRNLGVQATETPDGFRISGGQPVQGGNVHPSGDHRLAMSLLVSGLAAEGPVTVREAEILSESFPGFAAVLSSLGASLEGEAQD